MFENFNPPQEEIPAEAWRSSNFARYLKESELFDVFDQKILNPGLLPCSPEFFFDSLNTIPPSKTLWTEAENILSDLKRKIDENAKNGVENVETTEPIRKEAAARLYALAKRTEDPGKKPA